MMYEIACPLRIDDPYRGTDVPLRELNHIFDPPRMMCMMCIVDRSAAVDRVADRIASKYKDAMRKLGEG